MQEDSAMTPSDSDEEERGCTLFSFAMHPSLYAWSGECYTSVDNIPFEGLHSVYFQHGSPDDSSVSYKIQHWMYANDLAVVTVNRAVLDPQTWHLFVFDMLMKKEGNDSYGAVIGIVSHTDGTRGSLRRARSHGERLRDVCRQHYDFFPRVVIFRVSRNDSLRVITV